MVTVDDFLHRLKRSGLVPADDLAAFLEQHAAAVAAPDNAKPLATELVRRGKLTKYQATLLWQGQLDALVVGNYTILDVLGAGGMGTVFKAEHRRLKRPVAIKMLGPAAMKVADSVDRFLREAAAAGQLNHRNIVAAYDAGEFRGKHYLVMEYVEGADLEQLVDQRGPLPGSVAAACVLQAARGLDYAHARGVLHRDVKPANLLLASESGQPVVKLLDLGLAWVRDAAPQEAAGAKSSRLTQSDRIMGTVTFMAPEQALEIHSADHRADIYSLGCTWYFLVAGREIYVADSVLKRLVAHREAPIPDLPGASDELNAIFRKMVAKRAEDRQQSMAEVIAALEACGVTDAQAGGVSDLAGVKPAARPGGETRSSVQLSGTSPLIATEAAIPPRQSDSDVSRPAAPPPTTARTRAPLVLGAAAALLIIVGAGLSWFHRGGAERSAPPQTGQVAASPAATPAPETPPPATVAVATPAAAPPKATAPITPPDESGSPAPVEAKPTAPPDVSGEYLATIANEPWGLQVRRRNDASYVVRVFKGGLPGDGWDQQTVHDLAASVHAGKVTLDKNPRLAGEFVGDALTGADALGEPFVAQRTVRRSPTLSQSPPPGAVILFDGRSAEQWNAGVPTPEGWLMSGAATRSAFRDFRLHLEYRLPTETARGGLVLQGRYELAIADSFAEDASATSCGALAGAEAPALNASLPRSEWQTLDVTFTAARFDANGGKTGNARCSVRHNGLAVYDHAELRTATAGAEGPEPGPLVLKAAADSGIVFRNIWLEELRPTTAAIEPKKWPEPNAGLKKRMRTTGGLIRDDFALVHTLPLDEFPKVAEWFQECGYRPVRLRPFPTTTGAVQAAALWQRDGLPWRMSAGSAAEVQQQAESLESDGYWPIDIAGYLGRSGEAYVVLWGRLPEKPAEEARIFPGVRHQALETTFADLPTRGFAERVDQAFTAPPNVIVHSTLWWKSPVKTEGGYGGLAYYESQDKGFQIDICVARGPLTGAPAYAWCSLAEPPEALESLEVHGLSPDVHLRRCVELAEQGYRPVAIGAAHVNAPTAIQACSVWHRRKAGPKN